MNYVQYGCGLCAPASWRNFDASPLLQLRNVPLLGTPVFNMLQRRSLVPPFPPNVEYGDIVKGLPVADNSVAGVYCSHILEHLSLEDCRQALRNTYGLLKPGGVFRLVVPDLEGLARSYLADPSPQPASSFMRAAHLGTAVRPRNVKGQLHRLFGNSLHLWMWDYRSLAIELREAGFETIRRASFGDAVDEHFREVEEAGRWQDNLGIECVK